MSEQRGKSSMGSSASAEDVRDRATQLVSQKDESDLEFVQDRLYKMIDYAIGRVDYYEHLRARYQSMGVGLFGGGVAFASLAVGGQSLLGLTSLIFLLIAASALMVTGMSLIRKYNETSASDLHYRGFAAIRSWYYKYTVGDGTVENEQGSIAAFSRLVEEWMGFAQLEHRFLVEDLEQVFILYRLQDWKRSTVETMKGQLELGLAVAFGFFLLGGVFAVAHLY